MSKSKKWLVAVSIILVIAVAAAAIGVILWLKKNKEIDEFNENLHDMLSNVRLGNENFIGFSSVPETNSASAVNNGLNGEYVNMVLASGEGVKNIKITEESEGKSSLVAVYEDYNAEEVFFEKFDSVDNITVEDISEFGTLTRFGVMNGFLYVEITSNSYVTSSELKEDEYFEVNNTTMLVVVDLETRNLYNVNDTLKETFGSVGVWNVTFESDLIGININYIGLPHQGYYDLVVENDKLVARKIGDAGDFYEGNMLVDKYNNRYLIDDGDFEYNLSKINLNVFTMLVCEDEYEYFMSTDKTVYRAPIVRQDYFRFTNVERLDANKTWTAETSSSDLMIRDQITFSSTSAFYGGDFMLVDGVLVQVAQFLNTPGNSCYRFGNKIYATIFMETEERLIYLCNASDVTVDFDCIRVDESNYQDFTAIEIIEEDTNVIYLSIDKTRTGYILLKYKERFKIIETADGIDFVKITPIYNGFEFLSDIVYSW